MDFSLQPNTFQLIIAYDPSRYQTYVLHIYLDMGWNNEYIERRSMIGYVSLKSMEEKSLHLAPSMKSTAFRLHSRFGNTGLSYELPLPGVCLHYVYILQIKPIKLRSIYSVYSSAVNYITRVTHILLSYISSAHLTLMFATSIYVPS